MSICKILFLEFKSKCESGPYTFLRFETDLSLVLMDYLVSNHKSKANSVFIDLFVLITYETKKFEQFCFIFLFYTNTCVCYWNLQESLKVLGLLYFHENCDASIFCKFQSITLESKKNLHDSLLVGVDQWRKIVWNFVISMEWNVLVHHLELNVFFYSFVSLNGHDLFNRIKDIECLIILPELAGVNLSEIQQILNQETHDSWWRLLNFHTLFKLRNNFANFGCNLLFVHVFNFIF